MEYFPSPPVLVPIVSSFDEVQWLRVVLHLADQSLFHWQFLKMGRFLWLGFVSIAHSSTPTYPSLAPDLLDSEFRWRIAALHYSTIRHQYFDWPQPCNWCLKGCSHLWPEYHILGYQLAISYQIVQIENLHFRGQFALILISDFRSGFIFWSLKTCNWFLSEFSFCIFFLQVGFDL